MHQIKFTDGTTLNPGKIIGLGRNYLDHIRELGNAVPERAVIFSKPQSSLLNNGGIINLPEFSKECHHELELAVLIGKTGKNIKTERALDHVAGYAVALDLTLRDLQTQLKEKGLPWDIAKGFDTSCPLSAFVPADQVTTPNNLELQLKVNGVTRQKGNTAHMMRSIEEIIAEISIYFTLEPGDILLTGTPAGVARLYSGDILEGTIEQVGSLKVSVA
ncbi:fumarylacetoacetate hydrolase family protein [Pelovirga terrestris]|uniref:Fumarylacetoacetate hydrolase family protein n=1 Tax=Pelovirga terrestris TaxID=2771352 RepID=A0A8J6QNS9_9BACT|nr:fumarylacetoacetate hydrolase family protein [Pelovirga terrestris]MBD1400193.1 fumarylacetoacetate hydrolase family protein [Pelovirga terrestris]